MEQRNSTMAAGIPFFEGAEKKVEFWVDPGLQSLRSQGDAYWAGVAESAGAQVLSRISDAACDAYLLSESSLFVYDHRLIMITCGRTELPAAVIEVLRMVPAKDVRFFTYERKNEAFPHIQPTSFFDDIEILHAALPGRAFQFGNEDDHRLYLFHLDRPLTRNPRDMTVEILMYGIDEKVSRLFNPAVADGTAEVRARTGVADILPGFLIDDHVFEPNGYSLNAIRGEQYWTVHVTPERISSYASFETNHRFDGDLDRVANRVLDVFRPRSFDLVLFDQGQSEPVAVERYQLREHVAQDLDCGYRVRFLSYFQPRSGVRRPLELPVG